MEAELSHTTLIIIWAIGIQAFLLVLLLVFWLSRPTGLQKSAKVSDESFFTRNRKVFFAGGSVLLAATIAVATTYFFLFPDEEKYSPPNVRSLEMRSPLDSSPTENEGSAGYGATAGSKGSIKPPLEESGSRVREAVRKSIRGKNPAELKARAPSDPVLHSYLNLLNNWLAEEDVSRKDLGEKAALFYDVLVTDYGYKGKKSDVEQAIRQTLFFEKDKGLSYRNCGWEADATWEQNTAVIGGNKEMLNCLIIQSKWSGRTFAHCFPPGQPAAFFQAHRAAFLFFGGVFETISYKNMSDQDLKAVLEREGLTYRNFEEFCFDLGFTPRFSNNNPMSRKEVLSRLSDDFSHKTPMSDSKAATLKDFNENLLKACFIAGKNLFPGGEQTVNERFEQEKICLIPFE